jgi:Mg-chelatase subunit ChlD
MSPVKRAIFFLTAVGICLSSYVGGANRQVTVLVNALDERGVPIRGLRQDDFRAKSQGHEIQLVRLSFAEGPRRIVVLLDISGSMSGERDNGRWDAARGAALEFASSASPGTRLSLITFADDVKERVGLSLDRHEMLGWLNSSQANNRKLMRGRTALYEAILAAAKELDPPQPGDAIFVITDGEENASQVTSSQVMNILREKLAGIRLFSFLLPGSVPESPESPFEESRKRLREMISESGGFEVELTSPYAPGIPEHVTWVRPTTSLYDDRAKNLIKTSANALNLQISSFYLLTLELPNNMTKPKGWRLELVDSYGHSRKEVTLTYPGHLTPQSVQQAQH